MNVSFPIVQQYITPNTKRRSCIKMPYVGFFVAHDTGNVNSTAKNNADYFCRTANDAEVSAHLFVDDIGCYEVIPVFNGTPEKAWHVLYGVTLDNQLYGDDANDIAIGVELSFFNDTTRSQKAYQNYVELLAYLCVFFGRNPSKDIIGHEKLDPTRKVDPTCGLKYSNHTYQDLINDVVKKYNSMVTPEPSVEDCVQEFFWRGILIDKDLWNGMGYADKNIYWVMNKAYKYIMINGGSVKKQLTDIEQAYTILQKQGIITSVETWRNEVVLHPQLKWLLCNVADYIN